MKQVKTFTMKNENFQKLVAGNSDGWGGAINIYDHCSLNITNVTFSHNKASHDGGVIYAADNSRIYVHSSIFTNNAAGSTESTDKIERSLKDLKV